MKLVTFEFESGYTAGAVTGNGDVINLTALADSLPAALGREVSVRRILELGVDALAAAAACLAEAEADPDAARAKNALHAIDDVTLLAPVPNPKLILSVGLNYWKHLEEMAGTPVPKQPTAFIKARDTLQGSGGEIVAPPQCPDMIDYEGEFCVVMGRTCHNVSADDAMEYVAGYTLANDVSARDWVGAVFTAEGTFPAVQAWERNIMGKQLPGFTPCGPVFVTKDEIKDPHDLHMETRLNGEVMQSTRTDDMIFKLPELISYFSQWYRLHPGDIITTGSPAGVGFGRDPKVFMKPGDVVEVECEGIGVLRNGVV